MALNNYNLMQTVFIIYSPALTYIFSKKVKMHAAGNMTGLTETVSKNKLNIPEMVNH